MNQIFRLSDYSGSVKERFDAACGDLRHCPGSTLLIEPGTYVLSTPLARKTMEEAISGVYGEDPQGRMFRPDFPYDIGIDLEGMTDVTIDAYDVHLMIDGFMEPVSIRRSSNLRLLGLTLDHVREPYSAGPIVDIKPDTDAEEGYFTAFFDPRKYPLPDTFIMPRFIVYSPALGRYIHYQETELTGREKLGEGLWRFYGRHIFADMENGYLTIWHAFHSRPGILIFESSNVELRDVTIHSQPGMGIVAHRSRDLLFDRLNVVPKPGEIVSTNTDATHIASCKGDVIYRHCSFSGQADDSMNIHTYYHTIRTIDGNTAVLENCARDGTHTQMQDYPDIGDILELTDRDTLAVSDTYRVVNCERDGGRFVTVTLDKPIDSVPGNFFADATQCPRLTVEYCTMKNHIARGILIKTKWASVTDCLMQDITGPGIEVAAESNWSEGLASSESIILSRNVIRDCGRIQTICGSGGIAVTNTCENPTAKTHRHVEITDNEIITPDAPHAIAVFNTGELIQKNNRLVSRDEPIVRNT